MSDNNQPIEELTQDQLDIIQEYRHKRLLAEGFHPFVTYDVVQTGYPRPNKGIMVARAYGGTDTNGYLLPSNGMWCKVSDVVELIEDYKLLLRFLEVPEFIIEHPKFIQNAATEEDSKWGLDLIKSFSENKTI